MTNDAAFAALVEANPVPDAQTYSEHRLAPGVFLTATRERTKDMQTIDQQESREKEPKRKWQPLAAVAAFVLVIVVGVAAAFALSGGDSDVATVPAPPFDTPEEAVEAWVAALNTGDGEAYLLLFAQDASDGTLNPGGIASDATINTRVEFVAATETVRSVVECDAESASRTKCVVTSNSPVAAIFSGIGENEESIVLTIDESGAITRIGTNDIREGAVDVARIEAYIAWMDINYPELTAELDANWVTEPPERSGTDMGRDSLAAAREFDAQYEG